MAKFITTKQVISELEELIKKADKILYIVSPYLKLSKDFQELINSRNANKKETIIIYGKQELTPEQLNFLTGLRYVYLKFHENLHAKCYLNDSKLIITSLNFYEFSMMNNKEIGILYDNTLESDMEIYKETLDHIKFIELNSNDKPFELGNIKTNVPITGKNIEINKSVISSDTSSLNRKYYSITALSKELGISSKELSLKFEKHRLIEKNKDESILTSLGQDKGAIIKKGQYGEYIAWPENILELI